MACLEAGAVVGFNAIKMKNSVSFMFPMWLNLGEGKCSENVLWKWLSIETLRFCKIRFFIVQNFLFLLLCSLFIYKQNGLFKNKLKEPNYGQIILKVSE